MARRSWVEGVHIADFEIHPSLANAESTEGVPQEIDAHQTAPKTAHLPRKCHEFIIHLFKHQDQNSAQEMYTSLKWSRWALTRAASALEQRNLIRQIGGTPTFYELTSSGKSYVCGFLVEGKEGNEKSPLFGTSVSTGKITHRLHGPLTFSARIRFKGGEQMTSELQQLLVKDNFMACYPANQIWYKKRYFRVLVMFTPSTVQFFMPEFYGDEHEVYSEAMELLWNVISYLEDIFPGLHIGQPKQVARIIRQEFARLNDALAIEYDRTGQELEKKILYISDRLKIDKSKGIPELETHHKIFAKEDLGRITKLYEDVVRGDFDLKDFSRKLASMEESMRGFVSTEVALHNTMLVQATILKSLHSDIRKLKEIASKRQKSLKEFFS
jgi:hypothetical protein